MVLHYGFSTLDTAKSPELHRPTENHENHYRFIRLSPVRFENTFNLCNRTEFTFPFLSGTVKNSPGQNKTKKDR